MKPVVIQCLTCKKVKRFGEWVDQTRAFWEAKAQNLLTVRYERCPACEPGKTNRLLPVKER